MKPHWPKALLALPMLLLLTLNTACSEEDDYIQILIGKTWKMSRLTTKGSSTQFAMEWDTEEEQETSLSYVSVSSYYTITFSGAEIDGELVGNDVRIRGVDCTATGTWTADGNTYAMSFDLSLSGTESDPLAAQFINGIQNVYSYSGDDNNLNLYFKDDDGNTYVIGFTPR